MSSIDYRSGRMLLFLVGTLYVVSSSIALAADAKLTNEDWLLRALEHRITVDFQDQPLDGVIESLVEMLPKEEKDHFSMAFDWKAMGDAGIDRQSLNACKVTLRAKNIRLRSALDFVLRAYSLAWTIRDELLLITRREKADAETLIRVYDVEDLVVREGDPDRKPDFERLMDLITTQIAPTKWDEVGGDGTIAPYRVNGCHLVICQTIKAHLEIAQLLDDLRTALRVSPAAQKLKQALEGATAIEFVRVPLEDVVAFLNAQHDIDIQIDGTALKELTERAANTVTLNARNIRLRNALWLILQPLDLAYVIKDEVLLITTMETAEKLNAILYPVVPATQACNPCYPVRKRQPTTPSPAQEKPAGGAGMF